MNRYLIVILLGLTCLFTACGYTDYVKQFIRENGVSGSGVVISGPVVSGGAAQKAASGGAVSGTATSGSGIYSSAFVTAPMQSAKYWIGKSYAQDKVLLSLQEIAALNEKRMKALAKDSNAVYYDIQNYEDKIKGSVLHMLMAEEDFLKETIYYRDGRLAEEKEKADYLENCGIRELADFNVVRYGIICEECELKRLPTKEYLTASGEKDAPNAMNLTWFLVNDPVLVLYTSMDGKWYFVMGREMTGWIPADTVAFCPDKNSWQQAQKMDGFLIVTSHKITLADEDRPSESLNAGIFRMGTKLELARKNEAEQYLSSHHVRDRYIIRLPVRGKNGELTYRCTTIPVGGDVHDGYLDYTRDNILTLAMKYPGSSDAGYQYGISSVVRSVYSCFGFELPLDYKTWSLIPIEKNSTDVMRTDGQITKTVTNVLNPGMILIHGDTPCIYLGYEDEKAFVLAGGDDTMTVMTLS